MSNEGGSRDAAVQTGRILLPFLPGIPQELGSSSQVVEADSCQVNLHLTLSRDSIPHAQKYSG